MVKKGGPGAEWKTEVSGGPVGASFAKGQITLSDETVHAG
jgi:hypothetical protein